MSGARFQSPGGTSDNSPRIHPWVGGHWGCESRQGRKRTFGSSGAFFRPSGAWGNFESVYPPLKRWAIFGCPGRTKTTGGVEK